MGCDECRYGIVDYIDDYHLGLLRDIRQAQFTAGDAVAPRCGWHRSPIPPMRRAARCPQGTGGT